MTSFAAAKPAPLWLVAELSHRCPLQCPYCSNPVDLVGAENELTTAEWCRVLSEARPLGAVQLGLTGGEPLVRHDLEQIVAHADRLGYYSNLITSGVGLRRRLPRLMAAGIDSVQISFQSSNPAINDEIGGAICFSQKIAAAEAVTKAGLPLGINFVVHKQNIDDTEEMLQLALDLGASYVEFANVQFDGWALQNRQTLMPTEDQVERSASIVEAFEEKMLARASSGDSRPMKILYVVPDYFSSRPKPCGQGWASTQIVVSPEGRFLPCLGAGKLPLPFPHVGTHSVEEAWQSPPFEKYRGTDWLPEPCHSCPEREKDFGGCRCQAFALTGDAGLTDPTCEKSPHHALVKNFERGGDRSPTIVRRRVAQPPVSTKRPGDGDRYLR